MHFLFRLCLKFGIAHPDRVSEQLTSEQLCDWWAYFQHDPWGDMRADYRAFMASKGAWSDKLLPEWPYVETPMTPEEFRDALNG